MVFLVLLGFYFWGTVLYEQQNLFQTTNKFYFFFTTGISVVKCYQMAQKSCTAVCSSSYFQAFPFILLLIFETELNFFLLALPCAVQCYIWATVCFIEISRTFIIISFPLTPSFPLSCHSSLLFLSLLLLLQLSDDNAQLRSSCCIIAAAPLRADLMWE